MVETENSGTSQAPRRPYWGVMARAPLVTSLSHTSAEEERGGRGGGGFGGHLTKRWRKEIGRNRSVDGPWQRLNKKLQ